jgi:hypothetical protein
MDKKDFFGPFFEKKVRFFVKKIVFIRKGCHADLFTVARSYAANNTVHFIAFVISLLKINHL